MPVFDYYCDTCKREEEVLITSGEMSTLIEADNFPPHDLKCEECGQPLRNMISPGNKHISWSKWNALS